MPTRARQLTVSLPFGLGSMTFEPNEVERQTAWEIYVELETRVATQPLNPDHGLLREALDSLYDLFKISRDILKKAGPDVANGQDSVGWISIQVLNKGLREFNARWHPLLLEYESTRRPEVSAVTHERAWAQHDAMRKDLENKQAELSKYADALARIAGVKFPEDD